MVTELLRKLDDSILKDGLRNDASSVESHRHQRRLHASSLLISAQQQRLDTVLCGREAPTLDTVRQRCRSSGRLIRLDICVSELRAASLPMHARAIELLQEKLKGEQWFDDMLLLLLNFVGISVPQKLNIGPICATLLQQDGVEDKLKVVGVLPLKAFELPLECSRDLVYCESRSEFERMLHVSACLRLARLRESPTVESKWERVTRQGPPQSPPHSPFIAELTDDEADMYLRDDSPIYDELQVVKACFLALQGAPSFIFFLENAVIKCKRCRVKAFRSETIEFLLQVICECGSSFLKLDRLCSESCDDPIRQGFVSGLDLIRREYLQWLEIHQEESLLKLVSIMSLNIACLNDALRYCTEDTGATLLSYVYSEATAAVTGPTKRVASTLFDCAWQPFSSQLHRFLYGKCDQLDLPSFLHNHQKRFFNSRESLSIIQRGAPDLLECIDAGDFGGLARIAAEWRASRKLEELMAATAVRERSRLAVDALELIRSLQLEQAKALVAKKRDLFSSLKERYIASIEQKKNENIERVRAERFELDVERSARAIEHEAYAQLLRSLFAEKSRDAEVETRRLRWRMQRLNLHSERVELLERVKGSQDIGALAESFKRDYPMHVIERIDQIALGRDETDNASHITLDSTTEKIIGRDNSNWNVHASTNPFSSDDAYVETSPPLDCISIIIGDDQSTEDRVEGSKDSGLDMSEANPESRKKMAVNLVDSTIPDEIRGKESIADDCMISLNVQIEIEHVNPLLRQCSLVDQALMLYFLDRLEINRHFSTIRDFILLRRGDVMDQVCSRIFDSRAIRNLDVLLRSVLSSQHGGSIDKFSARVYFRTELASESSSLDPLDGIQLSYHAEYPLSTVLSPQTLACYGSVFQFLFRVQKIRFELLALWRWFQGRRRSHTQITGIHMHMLQLFYSRLRHVIETLQGYVCSQVIDECWEVFQERLKSCCTVSDLQYEHRQYLDMLERRCFLHADATVVKKTLNSIFSITLEFRQRLLQISAAQYEIDWETLNSMTRRFDKATQFLFRVLERLSVRGLEEMRELVIRLDFNRYLSSGITT